MKMGFFPIVFVLFMLAISPIAQSMTKVAVILIGEKKPGWEPGNVRLVRSLCLKANLECEVLSLSTQRSFTELQAGRVHFVMALEHNPMGAHPLKIAKVRTTKIVVLAKKSADTCESLKSMQLSAVSQTLYAQRLIARCPGLRVSWTNTYEQGMKMYRSGRVDGMVGVLVNFKNATDPRFGITGTDTVTEVAEEELWLFGNPASRDSEAAYRLQAAIAQYNLF